MHLHSLLVVGLAGVLTACVISDLRTRRIPNAITGPGVAAGVLLNCAVHGLDGLVAALGGLVLALVILTPPFALGGIGGGDVKMMGAAGSFLGPTLLAVALLLGVILGGGVAVASAMRRGRLRDTLRHTWAMASGAVLARSTAPLRRPATLPDRIWLPYSVPLALGTALTIGWTAVQPG